MSLYGIESLVKNISSVDWIGFTEIIIGLKFGSVESIEILTPKQSLSVQPSDNNNYVKCLEGTLFMKGLYFVDVKTSCCSSADYNQTIRFIGELYKEIKPKN